MAPLLLRTPSICSPIFDGVTQEGPLTGTYRASAQAPVRSEPWRETVVGGVWPGWRESRA